MKYTIPRQSGVTLLELSIVLVIIGLLVAGIMVGQEMIRSSELQKIASNFGRFQNATKLFKDKYRTLPGDMPTATGLWGTKAACDDTASDDTDIATCNGNGDGYITGTDGTALNFGTNYREALYFWQHLSNAKLIEGSYTGSASTTATWFKPGVNMPRGIDDQSGYTMSYALPWGIAAAVTYSGIGMVTVTSFDAKYNHIISYGSIELMDKQYTPTRIALSVADAQIIDTKIDDGKPGMGNVLALAQTADGGVTYFCVTGTSPSTSLYLSDSSVTNSDNDKKNCALIFITGM